ncbi:MAG TPA: hypothetical protein VIZ65_18205 [Cellvibrionaceae bacterium]
MKSFLKFCFLVYMNVGLILLAGCSGTSSGSSVQANAGSDQTAGAYSLVTLSGKISKTADGGSLTYQWKQLTTEWLVVSGGLNNSEVGFYVPAAGVPVAGADFELTVTDSSGKTSTDRVKIQPEAACLRAFSELFTNCLSGAKLPLQFDSQLGVVVEGFNSDNSFMQWALVDSQEANHGKVIDIKFGTDTQRHAFFAIQTAANYPQDLTAFTGGFVEFDIRVLDGGPLNPAFFSKIECVYPCQSADIRMQLNPGSAWQHVKIPLQNYIDSGLKLSRVNRMIAILPEWNSQRGVHFQLDNIKWVAIQNSEFLPHDFTNLTYSSPLELGFPADNGSTAKVSAYEPAIGLTRVSNGPRSAMQWDVTGNSIAVHLVTDDELSELIIDLNDTWRSRITDYLDNYVLSFDISGRDWHTDLDVFFTMQNATLAGSTSVQNVAWRLKHVEIPLRSFIDINKMPVDTLRLRFQNHAFGANMVITNLALTRPINTFIAPINSTIKMGEPGQEGYEYLWELISGPEISPTNKTYSNTAQLEFNVPSVQSDKPIIFNYKITNTAGAVVEKTLAVYRTGKCTAKEGVIYENCLEDSWGPLSSLSRVTFENGFYYFPFPSLQFGSPTYPVHPREIYSGDAGHNNVIDVLFEKSDNFTGSFGIPFASGESNDMQRFAGGSVEFDLKVLDYGKAIGGLRFSGYNAIEKYLPIQPLDEWLHISVPINSDATLSNIYNGFSITSANEYYSGIHFQVDNIRWVKAEN